MEEVTATVQRVRPPPEHDAQALVADNYHGTAAQVLEKVCIVTNPEKGEDDQSRPPRGFPTLLMGIGAVICLMVTIDSVGYLPFWMPPSWHTDREIWVGLGVGALVAGIMFQLPEKGDENDTR